MVLSAARLIVLALAMFAGGVIPANAQQAEPPLPALAGSGSGDENGSLPPAEAPPSRGAASMPTRTIEAPDSQSAQIGAAILTIDQERLFLESAWGRRAQQTLEQEGQQIADENERLATQLSEEEADLTGQRSTLEPAEFRRLAEAFDKKATEIRRDRAQAVQQLNARADADRTAFYQAALPLMGDLMQQRGAVAVLDRRTVFVSLDAIDITSELIGRLDEALGDGADIVADPAEPESDQQPAPDEVPDGTATTSN